MDEPIPVAGSTEPVPVNGADEPTTLNIGDILRPIDIRSVALTGIFIISLFFTIYFARPVLLPFALALMLNFLLRPVIYRLEKWHIPPPVGALFVLVLFIGSIVAIGYGLSKPAQDWIARSPQMMSEVGAKMRVLRRPVERVSKAAAQVGQIAQGGSGSVPVTTEVKVKAPLINRALLSGTQTFIGQSVVVLILLYFLLASGDFFMRKLIKVLPRLADKKRALRIANEMQHEISRYFFTVTVINAGLGVAIGFALYLVGMPNPSLWGALAFALNFIPYLGAVVGVILTALAAILTFDSIGQALLAPGVYMLFTSIEGNLITPMIMGRRMTINPVVLFVWLILWGWLWGVVGALIAVPMLAALKIFCDHMEGLSTLGEFIGN